MSANETLQQTYVPDRKLRRYEQVVRKSRMPLNRQNQAIARYKQAQAEMQRWIDVAQAAFDRLGKAKMVHRRQMATLARSLYSISRKLEREAWPAMMAQAAARHVYRGVDEETVLAALADCWRLVSEEDTAPVAELARKRAQELASAPKVALPSPTPGLAGVGQRISGAALAEQLSEAHPFDAVRQRDAIRAMKQALAVVKPWARQCVVARVARRRSYRQIAGELETTIEDVAEILRLGREHVRKFTTFFEDDWYWADLPGRTAKV